MSIQLTDPFDTICTSLQEFLSPKLPGIKYWMQEWPDPNWFEDVDVNFPSVLFANVSVTGQAQRSKLQPFATDANNIYFESLRQQLHIQITLITVTPDDRVSMGYTIVQSLVNQRQLQLTNGQRSVMRLRGDVSPKGSEKMFMRHVTFQFQARVLKATAGRPATTITPNTKVGPS